MSEVLHHALPVRTSALARTSCCVSCGGREVGDLPGEFDPRDWTATLVCLDCDHQWSVCC